MMPEATLPRPSIEDRIRAALWFAERGFGVFSVWSADERGVCRCPAGAKCEQSGKHPIGFHGFKDATNDPDRIKTLLSAGSQPNYGLVCPEGVFALDVDGDGLGKLAQLEATYGPLPETLRTQTAHGEHIFLSWPAELPRPLGQFFGFVTRWGSGRDAGYVIGPRSVHASGVAYSPSGSADIAQFPDVWARAVVESRPKASPTAITVSAGGYQLPERVGSSESRYEAIRAYTAHLYNSGLSAGEMWFLVRDLLAPRFESQLSEDELRARFERTTSKLGDRLGERRRGQVAHESKSDPVMPAGIDGADLLGLTLAPLRMIVPDLLPEGTTIIAAPPKVGKSCLVYQLVVEVSIGGDLLDRRVTPGSCLYLALEDGQRRGQDRLRTALAGRTLPHGRLEIQWSARHIGKGLEEDLEAWLDAHPDAAVVAIDTLQKVRAGGDSRRNAYEVDVEDLGRLQNLFRDRSCALLIVHHLRKESGDDFLTSVSGTYGLTGSADSTIVIRRKRLENHGKIVVTGRDIAETEISVAFDDMTWTAAEPVLAEASFERAQVYECIKSSESPIFPAEIAQKLGLGRTSVQNMVSKLAETGAVVRVAKGYIANRISLNTPVSLMTPRELRESSESGGTHTHARTHAREARCPVCGRDVELTSADVLASHYRPEQLESAKWGEPPCPGSGQSPAPTPVAVEPAATWAKPCHDYTNHQHYHHQKQSGWVCDECYPEEAFR